MYIVVDSGEVDSVHATSVSASQRVVSLDSEEAEVVKKELQGGAVQIAEKAIAEERSAPKASKATKREAPSASEPAPASKKKKATAAETSKVSKATDKNDAEPASSKPKTKTPAEQRAANAKKPGKPTDEDLPDNVKALLSGSGEMLDGMNVVVTGVPPTLGRKTTEALVTKYGGHLTKSLSKNTSLVVVGNDAGPSKLEKIEELGLKTVDEDAFIGLLET